MSISLLPIMETTVRRQSFTTFFAGSVSERPVRDTAGQGRIIRPILQWAQRREILDWLRAHGYPYVEDSTNSGTDYTRNLIRNELLPVITSRINGQAVQNIFEGRRTYLRGGPVSGKDGRRVGAPACRLQAAAGNAGTENSNETAVFMAAELLKEDRLSGGMLCALS